MQGRADSLLWLGPYSHGLKLELNMRNPSGHVQKSRIQDIIKDRMEFSC
jgi:hypothetical protein